MTPNDGGVREPHRAATVRDALDLLQRLTVDLPQEGLFDDVVVEVRGDPALGVSPDPDMLRDPLVMHVSLRPFTSTRDDGRTLLYPRIRGLTVTVVDEAGGDAHRYVRHGSLEEMRHELTSPQFESDLHAAFRHLAEWYCDPDP